jgi:hypothetical protein
VTTRSVLVLLLATGGCRGGADDQPRHAKARASSMQLLPEFAGCATVRVGPLCSLEPQRQLTIWLPSTATHPIALRADRTPITPTDRSEVAAGTRYTVVIPAGATTLAIEDAEGRRWTLRLAPTRHHEALRRARNLHKEGKLDQAEALLRRALPTLQREQQAIAHALLARIALARGEARKAAAGLDRNRKRCAAIGLVSQAVDDSLALAFVLSINLRELTRARRVLADADQLAKQWPRGHAAIPYYRGLIAWESGDVRIALRAFRRAAQRAERLGLKRPRRHAQQQIALTLAAVGRIAEAERQQRELLREQGDEPPCTRADLHTNLAWIAALHDQRVVRGGDSTGNEVATHLAHAARLLDRCPDPFRRRNALINETLWALQRGDLRSAAQRVKRLQALEGGHNAQLAVWQEEALGRYALASGQPRRALLRFQRQRALADAIGLEQGRFRAMGGLARAWEQLNQPRRAIDAYRHAETILTRWLEWVPFSEGRDAFLGRRDQNARCLTDLLVRQGKAAAAATAARLARARLLRATTRADRLARLSQAERIRWEAAVGRYRRRRQALEAAAAGDWALPADELAKVKAARAERLRQIHATLDRAIRLLHGGTQRETARVRAPAADELQLVYFPGSRGWLAIARWREGATAVRLEDLDPTQPKGLLAPFDRAIERARRITIYPYGALERVDYHALSWSGSPLLRHAPVIYPTDTMRSAGPPHPHPLEQIVIVGDPQGDLPGSRAEAKRIAQLLRSREPSLLLGRRASRDATLEALTRADLFHFAGHATFGGTEGSESALLLHQGQRLSLGDILALPRVPRAVVLSACDSAQSSGARANASGLGLAHAFIAAGAQVVIAAARPVSDGLARQLSAALFAKAEPTPEALANALRQAQLQVARTDRAADWASFRVLRP